MAMSSLTLYSGFFCEIFSASLSDTILKGIHPRTIPARFGLIWFSGFRGKDLNVIWFNGFRGKDLNVIFYQNMPNLMR
jgi:hypothetical protein